MRPETETERFERLSALFRKDTGFIAPGKSVPDAMGPTDEKARWDAWDAWLRTDSAMAARGIRDVPVELEAE